MNPIVNDFIKEYIEEKTTKRWNHIDNDIYGSI